MEGNNSSRVSFRFRRPLAAAIRSAAANPAQDRLVVLGIRFEALAAAVRSRHRRLQQQQTLLGIRQIDARNALALHFGGEHLVAAALGDPFVVVRRIERVGGELEAALAFDAAVARGAVAAALGEDAGDLAPERDRLRGRGIFDLERGFGLAAGKNRGERERCHPPTAPRARVK